MRRVIRLAILRVLAAEQDAGRLAITPRGVMSASEVLTDEARGRLHSAFGVNPTNVYGATGDQPASPQNVDLADFTATRIW